MKKLLLFLLLVALPLLTACTKNSNQATNANNVANTQSDVIEVDEEGNTSFNKGNLENRLDGYSYSELSAEEKEGIIFMIEEEKLAHDVYAFLYDKWGIKVFSNISSSEQTHTEAVQILAAKYDLELPQTLAEAGKYDNADLQKLYNDLTGQGSQSLQDALKVGAAIEEIDILDLQEYISQTDKEDIILVYENLMKGSRNHLRSFVRNIGEYSPQYLEADAYNDIVNADIERGSGSQGNNSGRQGNNGGRNR